jgi:hypothetical protein
VQTAEVRWSPRFKSVRNFPKSPDDTEGMRSKVFLSCGQRSSEVEVAKAVGQMFEGRGFEEMSEQELKLPLLLFL